MFAIVIAGFFTGGSLAIRGGYKAARNSAIMCAVFLGVIEGVGIGFQRMMADNTKLEVRFYDCFVLDLFWLTCGNYFSSPLLLQPRGKPSLKFPRDELLRSRYSVLSQSSIYTLIYYLLSSSFFTGVGSRSRFFQEAWHRGFLFVFDFLCSRLSLEQCILTAVYGLHTFCILFFVLSGGQKQRSQWCPWNSQGHIHSCTLTCR